MTDLKVLKKLKRQLYLEHGPNVVHLNKYGVMVVKSKEAYKKGYSMDLDLTLDKYGYPFEEKLKKRLREKGLKSKWKGYLDEDYFYNEIPMKVGDTFKL